MNDSQRSRFEFEFIIIPQWAMFVIGKRVGIKTHSFIQASHLLNLVIRHSGALEQPAMFLVLQATGTMTGLPFVYKHLGVLSFISEGTRKTAVVFMRMRKNNPPNIRYEKPSGSQTGAQGIDG